MGWNFVEPWAAYLPPLINNAGLKGDVL